MAEPTFIRWGILGPGNIARTFTRNLLQRPPSANGDINTDPTITHAITAVASSSSLLTAQKFIDTNISPYQSRTTHQCTAYSSYDSLLTSTTSQIDIIYISTPHSSHFRTAMLALSHNKPVLVEKPLCVNSIQASILIATARERNVFMMEAVWTRFFPVSLYVQDVIRNGEIGEVVKVSADFSLGCRDQEGVEEMFGIGDENRMVNPDLAGGVLLDLGVYALTWVFLCVWHLCPTHVRDGREPVLSGVAMTPFRSVEGQDGVDNRSGRWVDASTTLLLTMPSAPKGSATCHAVASSSLYTSTDPGYGGDDPHDNERHMHSAPSVRIQGSHGEIQLFGPLPRMQRARVFRRVEKDDAQDEMRVVPGHVVNHPSGGGYQVEEKVFESMGDGNGMFWEADEAGRCLRDGKLESELMPWEETLAVMKVMDEARQKCGLDYGLKVEGVEWE